MDLLEPNLLCFLLVFARVGAFFFAAPIFSWQSIPTTVKLTLTIFVSLFLTGAVSHPGLPRSYSALEAGLMMSGEVIYGLALGLVAFYIFGAVKVGARICEREMGLSMASILDPMTQEQGEPLGILMEMIFILLFLAANGHHVFLVTLSRSYETFPIGSIPAIDKLTASIATAGSTMLILGLRISAPILAAFLLLMVVLAFLARIAPETNILFLSLPLKVGLGLIMVGIFLPFIGNFVTEFAEWLNKLIPL